MRQKKIIDTKIQEQLSQLDPIVQALYFRLLIHSDDAGMVPYSQDYNTDHLCTLMDAGLITVTKEYIFIRGYLTANYGPQLKETYNPHKPILAAIQTKGYNYNRETNEISIPESSIIRPPHSSNKLPQQTNSTNPHPDKETSLQSKKQDNVIQFIGSIRFALWLSILLMIGQSVHTSYTLMSLSHIPDPFNTVAAIFTALIMDFLIIYFVINGRTNQSMVFFLFCSSMSLYSYHIQTEYFTYQSFFAMVVSFALPYAVHSVSGMVSLNKTPST